MLASALICLLAQFSRFFVIYEFFHYLNSSSWSNYMFSDDMAMLTIDQLLQTPLPGFGELPDIDELLIQYPDLYLVMKLSHFTLVMNRLKRSHSNLSLSQLIIMIGSTCYIGNSCIDSSLLLCNI